MHDCFIRVFYTFVECASIRINLHLYTYAMIKAFQNTVILLVAFDKNLSKLKLKMFHLKLKQIRT